MFLGKFSSFFSQQYSESLNFIQVERATAHKAKSLEIPKKLILLFQPSHSREIPTIEGSILTTFSVGNDFIPERTYE
ncbi:MAG: hypothetical protein BRC52_14230 [Cyanobacteria bacterium SW_5_48_44]|nr:MAG: hypothetical protein BRC52_14230 [Cyanobacteria bacterium SW_5_48_44]